MGDALVCGAVLTSLLAAGCSAPFAARRASPHDVRRSLTADVLSTDRPSNFSTILLHRQNLTDAYDSDPATALRILHDRYRRQLLPQDALAALAELSFAYAEEGGGRPYFFAAAIYAYAYVFPADPDAAPDRLDPRLRTSADIYNRALTEAFETGEEGLVEPASGTYPLPFGELAVTLDEDELLWGTRRRMAKFDPAAETEVIGFENRYRKPGIGAPLAATLEPLAPDETTTDFVGERVRIPVALLLRIDDPREQIGREHITGTLELYSSTESKEVAIGDWTVPLEQEPTVALALSVTEARPWADEISMFLGKIVQADMGPRLAGREPHRRGRIPVVFVHGTASNPSVWFNMVNDLDSDPEIRRHFDFALFRYDSGQPILYSGMRLREMLRQAVSAYSADVAEDPCLQEMVLIGHSQGGLLVKLAVIDSGDAFWRNISDEPFEEVEFSPETRALLAKTVFVEHLPFVSRAIFIATPHRGSYLAGPSIVRRLAQRLIRLPGDTVRAAPELLGMEKVRQYQDLQQLPTSIDNMSPGHPFIETISTIPVSTVPTHSIVGIVDDDPPETGGDGVVKYLSAHIDEAESELVVPYPHSMQSKPEVVAEVQRILHRHLEEVGDCRESRNEDAAK